MNRSMLLTLCAFVLGTACLTRPADAGVPNDERPDEPIVDVYISTGDNHFLGASLAIDSEPALIDTFDFFKEALNVRRVYWRGLQELTTLATLHKREENFRYATAVDWFEHLLVEKNLEPLAAKLAHERGLEFWGVGTLGDWGCRPDTPGFNDFPWFWESTLRLEHPEWVPVDKYGYRKQGGTIELAYPEARKALVDLHTRLAVEAGYDGVILLSYVENFSQRFQDEFGYSEPIVKEFKRRYGIDIRHEPFNKYASRSDWYRLRGEYVTQYLRELKQSLSEHGIELGMFINPRTPRKPGVWATLPHEYWTLGNIHFDVDAWVRDGIVDDLVVMGASARTSQMRTLDELLYLTRETPVDISATTSSPFAPGWGPYYAKGVPLVIALGEDEHYFLRGGLERQGPEALESGDEWEIMMLLSQVIAGETKVPSAKIVPLLEHERVIMRRLAVHALGVLGDPAMVPRIEAMLDDPENGVRCKAMQALRYNNRPETADAIFRALERHGVHPLHEMARDTLARIRPFPLETMRQAMQHEDPVVRTTAIRAFRFMGPKDADVPTLVGHLDDSHRYARYAAAFALGQVRDSEPAVAALIAALQHEDPAVANRAATSLEDVVRRGGAVAEQQRSHILDALVGRFSELGDGYDGSDAEWGYRPVGNAILAFGPDGEAALERLSRQSQDKRLAELAWRVLTIREKSGPNAFNVITEEQAEEGFRKRPIWLKTTRIPRLNATFEEPAFNDVQTHVGDPHVLVGRWGGFAEPAPTIDDEQAHSGERSLRLVRGSNAVAAYFANPIDNAVDYEAVLWVYRDQDDSSMLIQGKGREPALGDEWSVYLMPDGRLNLRQMQTQQWIDTGLRIPSRQWTPLRVVVSRARGEYTAALGAEEATATFANQWLPLRTQGGVYRMDFVAQGTEGNVTHIDDVAMIERP